MVQRLQPVWPKNLTYKKVGRYLNRRGLAARCPLRFWGDQCCPLRTGGQMGELMEWARILAYIEDFASQSICFRHERIGSLNRKDLEHARPSHLDEIA
jgi:hypothetical protein